MANKKPNSRFSAGDGMSQSDYDKIKAEYKEHFQKMKELKERVVQAKHSQRIAKALQDMDPQPVLDSVDDMIHAIKVKASEYEAKISMAFDVEDEELQSDQKTAEFELEMQKKQAKETLAQIKFDLDSIKNQVKSETENKAEHSKDVIKTVGKTQENQPKMEEKPAVEIKKTLGPKK